MQNHPPLCRIKHNKTKHKNLHQRRLRFQKNVKHLRATNENDILFGYTCFCASVLHFICQDHFLRFILFPTLIKK